MRRSECGFTLIEVVVGAAIAAVVTFALVATALHAAKGAAILNSRLVAQSNAANLAERLTAESASAWAVFVPPTDVRGGANADGHELDFFAEDGAHRPYAWAYRYDATSKMLCRYSYAPGVPAVAGELFGPFDAFSAASADASAVSQPGSAVYDPLFANLTVPDVDYASTEMPGALGGNRMTRIKIAAHGVDFERTLASATAPTTFTIRLTYTPAPPTQTPTPSPLPTFTP